MNRKYLIICLSATAVMLVGIVALLVVLYWNPDGDNAAKSRDAVLDNRELLAAVPSNAVAVALFGSLKTADSSVLLHDSFIDALTESFSQGKLNGLKNAQITVSYHYSASLVPLYLIDAGKSTSLPDEAVGEVKAIASSSGLICEEIDCSKMMSVDESLQGHTLIAVSSQKNLPAAAERHLENSTSILDVEGVVPVLGKLSGANVLIVSNAAADKLLSALGSGFRAYSRFLSNFSRWIGFSFSKNGNGVALEGAAEYDSVTDFASVVASSAPCTSPLAKVLPSNTFFALSIPFRSAESYRCGYESWLDTCNKLSSLTSKRKSLAAANGISPVEWESSIGVSEVATASYVSGGVLQRVNLVRFTASAADVKSYPEYLASLYGDEFLLENETCSAIVDGWMVSGSKEGVEAFQSSKANGNLADKLVSAGVDDGFSANHSSVVYVNLDENLSGQQSLFSANAFSGVRKVASGSTICPLFLTLKPSKNGISINLICSPASVVRSKGAAAENDTEVIVPKGPFSVKNCHTGKMNSFYQEVDGSLCLSDENGKILWQKPFDGKICGMAETVDYFKNGKLQILFAAGNKLYLIDRLGNFVGQFDVQLEKEVILGPAVHDLSGSKRYNVLVLNKDNTIDMYNLKGVKPSSWKAIAPDSTIKAMPERIDISGKTYWVVRTSSETLVYPLMGGEPVFRNTGDDRIRPDSNVDILPDGSLKMVTLSGNEFVTKL